MFHSTPIIVALQTSEAPTDLAALATGVEGATFKIVVSVASSDDAGVSYSCHMKVSCDSRFFDAIRPLSAVRPPLSLTHRNETIGLFDAASASTHVRGEVDGDDTLLTRFGQLIQIKLSQFWKSWARGHVKDGARLTRKAFIMASQYHLEGANPALISAVIATWGLRHDQIASTPFSVPRLKFIDNTTPQTHNMLHYGDVFAYVPVRTNRVMNPDSYMRQFFLKPDDDQCYEKFVWWADVHNPSCADVLRFCVDICQLRGPDYVVMAHSVLETGFLHAHVLRADNVIHLEGIDVSSFEYLTVGDTLCVLRAAAGQKTFKGVYDFGFTPCAAAITDIIRGCFMLQSLLFSDGLSVDGFRWTDALSGNARSFGGAFARIRDWRSWLAEFVGNLPDDELLNSCILQRRGLGAKLMYKMINVYDRPPLLDFIQSEWVILMNPERAALDVFMNGTISGSGLRRPIPAAPSTPAVARYDVRACRSYHVSDVAFRGAFKSAVSLKVGMTVYHLAASAELHCMEMMLRAAGAEDVTEREPPAFAVCVGQFLNDAFLAVPGASYAIAVYQSQVGFYLSALSSMFSEGVHVVWTDGVLCVLACYHLNADTRTFNVCSRTVEMPSVVTQTSRCVAQPVKGRVAQVFSRPRKVALPKVPKPGHVADPKIADYLWHNLMMAGAVQLAAEGDDLIVNVGGGHGNRLPRLAGRSMIIFDIISVTTVRHHQWTLTNELAIPVVPFTLICTLAWPAIVALCLSWFKTDVHSWEQVMDALRSTPCSRIIFTAPLPNQKVHCGHSDAQSFTSTSRSYPNPEPVFEPPTPCLRAALPEQFHMSIPHTIYDSDLTLALSYFLSFPVYAVNLHS